MWCIKLKVLFGKLDFPEPEAGTETDLEAETGSENRPAIGSAKTTTPFPTGFKKVGKVCGL